MAKKFDAGWGVVGCTLLGALLGVAVVVLATIAAWGHFPDERYLLSTVAVTVYSVEIAMVGAALGLLGGYVGSMRFFKLGQPGELAKTTSFFGSLICGLSLVFCFCWHDLKLWLPCIICAALVPAAGFVALKRVKRAATAPL